MSRYVFLVMTNSVEGKDSELSEWYAERHLADVVALPAFVSAQHFRLASRSPAQDAAHQHLALYEVETDDLDAAHAHLASVLRTDAMPLTDCLDEASVKGWYYEPVTDVVTKS